MKLVKCLCVAFFAGVALSANAQTFSKGIVGYINQPLYAGDNLIANQLSYSNNTLNAIFQSAVPEGATFAEWNPASQQYLPTSVYDVNTGWSINYELDYGQGGLFNSPVTFTNTFAGAVWPGYDGINTFVPPLVTDSGTLLLSCYIPIAPATFQDVVGRDPLNGESVTVLDPVSKISTTTQFEDGVWDNGTPTLNIGQSAFFDLEPVPEPAVCSLVGAGLLLLATALKRAGKQLKQRQKSALVEG
ncbi:MAG: hypothetical protein ABSF60_13785 [Verrucomicrobiota bacterium]